MTSVGYLLRNLFSRRDESGAAFVEFAISLPIVLYVFLGVINLGAFAWQAARLNDALEAGAFFVMKNGWTTNSPGDINTAVLNAHASLGATATTLSNSVIQVTCSYGCPTASPAGVTKSVSCSSAQPAACASGNSQGQYVTINVHVPWSPIVAETYIPFALPNPITANATVRIQ